MATINVYRLLYDVHAYDRTVALDTQNRISAMTANIASCLNSALEKYDRPDFYMTFDRIELNLNSINYENLENELLQKINEFVEAEMAKIFFNFKIDHFYGEKEIKPNINKFKSVKGIKCEKISDHKISAVKFFIENGFSLDKTTDAVLTKSMIVDSFHKYPDIKKWFLTAQKKNINVLERLLFHLSDKEMQSIITEMFIPSTEVSRELIELLSYTGTFSQEQLRVFYWRFIFIQNTAGKKHFDYLKFIRAFSENFSISFNDCISRLPRQMLKKIGIDAIRDNIIVSETAEMKVSPISKNDQNKNIHHLEKNQFCANADLDSSRSKINRTKLAETMIIAENDYNYSTKEAIIDQEITRINEKIEITKIKPVSKMDEKDTRLINTSIDKRANEQETKHKNASIELLPHSEFETNEKFYIHNAGIVLAAPFLNRFFQTLKYIENGQFINQEKQKRAVVLLEYFYPPHEISETSMILNKALCGLEIRTPVPVWMKPEAFELKEIDELIQSLIHYWTTLKNTSVDAFKYNFFNRNAIMTMNEHQLHLHIQRESIDVLIETLPWSISIIKHAWMKNIIMVNW